MRSVVLLAALSVAACGVPEAKYNAALKDAQDARAEQKKNDEAQQKRIAELEDEIKKLKGEVAGHVSSSEANQKELEELRRAKAQAEQTAKLFKEFVARFKKLTDAGKLKIVARQGRLVLQLQNDVLFDVFKTDIKPAGKAALIEIAQTLKTVPNRKFQVAGHTDVFPINTKEFPSNWELSTARAIEVVKLLVANGVQPHVLSASGYSMYDPLGKDAAKNRRTEIVLVPNIEELIHIPELKQME
jgi:chemotaxis protein MotB